MRNEGNLLRTRIHYGWVIVCVCTLMLLGSVLISSVIAVSLSALRSQYGFSGTATSLIVTVSSASALLTSFFSDRYFGRLGLRRGMTGAALSGAVTFIIFGIADGNIWVYYLGAVFGGFTYAFGMILPASMLMRRWFNKNRGLALSICSAGTGLSSAFGAPLLQIIIDTYNVSVSFFAEAGYFIVLAIMIFVLIRNDPSEMGLEPYGGSDYVQNAEKNKIVNYAIGGSLITVLFILALLGGMTGSPSMSNIVLCMTTEGYDSMKAALGMSVYGVLLVIGKILFGATVDRKGACFATALFGSFVVIGELFCFSTGFFSEDYLMFMSFIMLGAGFAVVTLGYPNWAAELVGKDDYPKTMKRLQIGFQTGTLIGSAIPGIVADLTGHYTWAYLMFAAVFLTIVISIVCVYRKAEKNASAVRI